MECIALGDSIAVGIAKASNCIPMAQVGRSTSEQAALIARINANLIVISIGSNDPNSPSLMQDLERIRESVLAYNVIWILPYNRKAAAAIRAVAGQRYDRVIDLMGFSRIDNAHPKSYQSLAIGIFNGPSENQSNRRTPQFNPPHDR